MMIDARRCLVLAAALAVLVPAPSFARRSVTVHLPEFEVPPQSNREICTFVPVKTKKPMDVSLVLMKNLGANEGFATHHLILYSYEGDLTPLAGIEGQVADDTACLNFGGGDSSKLRIVATSQAIDSRQPMPRRTALRLVPHDMAGGKKGVGLVLNSHWINGSGQAQRAGGKVKLVFARKKAVKRELKPIFEVIANGFLKVAPGETREASYRWAPGNPGLARFGAIIGGSAPPDGPACVTMLIGHMHRRGTLFTADYGPTGGPKTNLYTNTQYADPPTLRFPTPLLVKVGEEIEYKCTHDNATDPRLGCEEEAGVMPGRTFVEEVGRNGDLSVLDGSARLCRTPGVNPTECPPGIDPDRSNRTLTGNCVPANLVFGFLSEDDMCILPGYYYDADPDAPEGKECEL
jgi:hypothetical protein